MNTAVEHFSEETMQRFQHELNKYPDEQKQSAVIACLSILQQENGFVTPEQEKALAAVLEMPVMAVHEVFTFYNMFNQKPVGQFKINVCTNLPCQLRGGQKALEHLCKKLSIEVGQTTADGMFTLQPGECMGACADAPVLLVNDRSMCSFMSHDKLDQLIDGLQQAEAKA
ncbi:MAG: NAD(P)H-dependent oxidoreductase subunit E [Methylotenera sp.]|jgi:NADH-quinone oxidoreductase subunit E|nr:NAD(P)H-dependent oxidoreductase subunit E [Methylotenera sp.]